MKKIPPKNKISQKEFESVVIGNIDDIHKLYNVPGDMKIYYNNTELKSFISSEIARARKEEKERVVECFERNLFSHRNQLCECFLNKVNEEIIK